MLNYSETTMNRLRALSADCLDQLVDGKPVLDILSDAYCILPDKSPELGRLMADQILTLVDGYESNKRLALQDFNAWAEQHIDILLADKDCPARCGLLMQLLLGFTALNDQANDQEILQDAGEFDPSCADDKLEQELCAKLIEAMKGSTLGIVQMETLLENVQGEDGQVNPQTVIDFGRNDRDVKAILSMIAYVSAKNGSLEDIPAETTLEEIVPSVCFGCDTVRISAQVGVGEMDVDMAATVMQALGAVAGLLVTAAVVVSAVAVASILLAPLPAILSLPAVLATGVVVATTVFNPAARLSTRILSFGWKVIHKTVAGIVIPGARLLLDVLKNKVWPTVRNMFEGAKAYALQVKERIMHNKSGQRESIQVPAQ